MRRPEELNSMLRHAEHQVNTAQLHWAKARQQVTQADARLQELKRYADEYVQGAQAAVNVGELVNRKQFNARLQEAVDQQELALEHARKTASALQARWQERQQNLAALEHLKAQREQALLYEKARLEQRALDEFASRSIGTR